MRERFVERIRNMRALKTAWLLMKHEAQAGLPLLRDPLRFADSEHDIEDRLQAIQRRLIIQDYRTARPMVAQIPKGFFTWRFGILEDPDDALVSMLVCWHLAERLDNLFPDNVLTYRLRKGVSADPKKGLFTHGGMAVGQRELERANLGSVSYAYASPPLLLLEIIKDRRRQFDALVLVDSTSYFENIDHHRLLTYLRPHLESEPFLRSILEDKLLTWSRALAGHWPPDRGLPQGPPLSSCLANAYLLHVDEAVARASTKTEVFYARTMDDLYVLLEDGSKASAILGDVTASLKELTLTPQPTKTRIIFGKTEIRRYLEESRRPLAELLSKCIAVPRSHRKERSKVRQRLQRSLRRITRVVEGRRQERIPVPIKVFQDILAASRTLHWAGAVNLTLRERSYDGEALTVFSLCSYLGLWPSDRHVTKFLGSVRRHFHRLPAYSQAAFFSLVLSRERVSEAWLQKAVETMGDAASPWFLRREGMRVAILRLPRTKAREQALRVLRDEPGPEVLRAAMLYSYGRGLLSMEEVVKLRCVARCDKARRVVRFLEALGSNTGRSRSILQSVQARAANSLERLSAYAILRRLSDLRDRHLENEITQTKDAYRAAIKSDWEAACFRQALKG